MLETLINTMVFNTFGVMEMTPQGGQKEAFGHDIFDQISLIVKNHQISHLPLCAVFARGGMSQTPHTAADLALCEHGGSKGSYISCCAVLWIWLVYHLSLYVLDMVQCVLCMAYWRAAEGRHLLVPAS